LLFSKRRNWPRRKKKRFPPDTTSPTQIPGVEKKDVNVKLESDVLRVEGQIDFSKYENLEPVYSEYNVGHYARAFTLSDKIDQDGISAELDDGVLTLTLKKSKEALPRPIAIR
jgi:HSP20 family protein